VRDERKAALPVVLYTSLLNMVIMMMRISQYENSAHIGYPIV